MSRKRDNFVRLAESRVSKAIDALRVIGNLANRSNYEYSEEDARKIMAALHAELVVLKGKFNPTDTKHRDFKLEQ